MYEEHEVTGILPPLQQIENNDELIVCPAIISSICHQHMVQITNFQDQTLILKKAIHIAIFSILTPEQMK